MKLVNLTNNQHVNPEDVTSISINFYSSEDGHCAVEVHLSDGSGVYVANECTCAEAEKIVQETITKLMEAD